VRTMSAYKKLTSRVHIGDIHHNVHYNVHFLYILMLYFETTKNKKTYDRPNL
jgi:hypothetical protein